MEEPAEAAAAVATQQMALVPMSSFEKLPSEIRCHVYSYLLLGRNVQTTKVTLLAPAPHYRFRTAILGVNHLLHDEAHQYLCSTNEFVRVRLPGHPIKACIDKLSDIPIVTEDYDVAKRFGIHSMSYKIRGPYECIGEGEDDYDFDSDTDDEVNKPVRCGKEVCEMAASWLVILHEELPKLLEIIQFSHHYIYRGHIFATNEKQWRQKLGPPYSISTVVHHRSWHPPVDVPDAYERCRKLTAPLVDALCTNEAYHFLCVKDATGYTHYAGGSDDSELDEKLEACMEQEIVSAEAVGWDLYTRIRKIKARLDRAARGVKKTPKTAKAAYELLVERYGLLDSLIREMSVIEYGIDVETIESFKHKVEKLNQSWQTGLAILRCDILLTLSHLKLRLNDAHSAWHAIDDAEDCLVNIQDTIELDDFRAYLAKVNHHKAICMGYSSRQRGGDPDIDDRMHTLLDIAFGMDPDNDCIVDDLVAYDQGVELDLDQSAIMDYPIVCKAKVLDKINPPKDLPLWRGTEEMLSSARIEELQKIAHKIKPIKRDDDDDHEPAAPQAPAAVAATEGNEEEDEELDSEDEYFSDSDYSMTASELFWQDVDTSLPENGGLDQGQRKLEEFWEPDIAMQDPEVD